MNRFGIYTFQFDIDTGKIKAYETTMIGEVNMSAAAYNGMSIEDACWKRIRSELKTQKNLPNDQLINHVVGLICFEFLCDKESHADSEIHKVLEDKGFHRHERTEMFDIGGNYATVVGDAICILSKQSPYKELKLRYQQQLAANKMTDAFDKGYDTFLLGALCRFGKTTLLLHYFTKVNPKANILMITAKCDALKAWQEDYDKFVPRDWKFLTKHDILNGKQFADKNICVCSFQSAAKDYDDDDCDYELEKDREEARSLGSALRTVKWDVLIIDECHFGSMTKRSLDFIDKLSIGLKVDVSATPFKKIESGAYSRDNSFIFDLVDEKLVCNDPEIAPTYVPCSFFHLDFGRYGLNGKFDKDKDGKKLSRSLIEEQLQKFSLCWNDFLFDWAAYFNGFNSMTLLEHFEQLYAKCFSKHGKNFAVFVNKIAHGKALAAALEHGPFEVVNVCGDSRFDLTDINRKLDKSEKPVIIISCGRDLTGVTLTRLHGLIIMGTLRSAENYFQFALRGKNWYDGRKFECSVFDLNPKSFIQTSAFGRYIAARADYLKQSLEQTAKESLECFEIFEINDYDNIARLDNLDELVHNAFGVGDENIGGALLEKWMIQSDSSLLVKSLATALCDVDPGAVKKTITITDDQTAGRATKKSQRKNETNDKHEQSFDVQLAIQKMKTISKIIVQLMGVYEIKHLDEIAASKELQDLFLTWTNAEWMRTFEVVRDYFIDRNEAYKWNDLDYAFSKSRCYLN